MLPAPQVAVRGSPHPPVPHVRSGFNPHISPVSLTTLICRDRTLRACGDADAVLTSFSFFLDHANVSTWHSQLTATCYVTTNNQQHIFSLS